MALTVRSGGRLTFVCSACGAVSPRWEGRCPSCEAWNSLVEQVMSHAGRPRAEGSTAVQLGLVSLAPPARIPAGFAEVDRVLGGGAVAGSVILLGGDPGVGKSTLAL